MSPLSPTPLPCEGRGAFGGAAEKLAAAAAILLAWRPDEFWNATPQELATALKPFAGDVEAPDAEAIAALRRRFPDEE